MNYSELVELLNRASAFDLYRLRTAIDSMIDDPRRIIEVKASLRLGQEVTYFEGSTNSVHEGVVESIKKTRVVVRDKLDGKRWSIPLCAINIRDVDVTIQQTHRHGLTKNELAIGDRVGFIDKSGIERSGEVVRLNQKTVTVESETGGWRVAYQLLHKVIDTEIA